MTGRKENCIFATENNGFGRSFALVELSGGTVRARTPFDGVNQENNCNWTSEMRRFTVKAILIGAYSVLSPFYGCST